MYFGIFNADQRGSRFSRLRWWHKSLIALVAFFVLFVPWPSPIPYQVQVATSPTGEHIAVFTTRPAGLTGIMGGDNPWVYLKLTNAVSGKANKFSV